MAVLIVPYTDINATMRGIRQQVIDSLEFCVNEMPRFDDPEQMFKALKNMVTYKNDPPGTELLQSVPTLFKNNYWGISGAGDCDCFSILVLSMCVAHGWNKQEIILAGRSKLMPVHIWTVVYVDGKRYSMDLTNAYCNLERNYKFIQVLPV
jgi:transglutaminase-like putative cysteine protease